MSAMNIARQKVLFMHAAPSSAERPTVIVLRVFFDAYASDAISSDAFDASGARMNAT